MAAGTSTRLLNRSQDSLFDAGLLSAAFLLLVIFIGPFGNFPLQDDWAYAFSVKNWQETARLRISDWASPNLVLQLWWGRLFCLGGFSHTALRISTILLASASIGLFNVLLKRSGVSRPSAAMAAACLALNPLFLNLSLTFMTDIPFMFLCLLALLLFQRFSSLWPCGWAIAAACLVRQPGLLLAAGLAWELSRRESLTRSHLAALMLPSMLAMGTNAVWFYGIHGPTWARLMYNMVDTAVHVLHAPSFIRDVVLRCGWFALYMGMAALPLTLPALCNKEARIGLRARLRELDLARRLFWWIMLIICLAMALWQFPSSDGILSPRGIGMATPLIRRMKPGGFLEGRMIWLILGAASVVSWSVLSLRHLADREDVARWMPAAVAPLLLWVFVGRHFSDRYLLIFIPAALYSASFLRFSWPGCLLAALIGGYSLSGTIDDHRWHEAFWRGGQSLQSRGVAPERIWGNFEWIAWHNYQPVMDELRAEKPLSDIRDREWLERVLERRQGQVSFHAEPPEDFDPAGELDYFSPLSWKREKVFLSRRREASK